MLSRRKFVGATLAGAGVLKTSGLGHLAVAGPLRKEAPSAKADETGSITIEIELTVEDGKLVDKKMVYSRESARERKEKALPNIRKAKQSRTKTYVPPYGDHSEHLEHDTIMGNPGDRVVWKSSKMFMLCFDYDYGPCDPLPDTPRNPFGWSGAQLSKKRGRQYVIEGIVQNDKSMLEQRFYKYTAMTEGAEALDPDFDTP